MCLCQWSVFESWTSITYRDVTCIPPHDLTLLTSGDCCTSADALSERCFPLLLGLEPEEAEDGGNETGRGFSSPAVGVGAEAQTLPLSACVLSLYYRVVMGQYINACNACT